MKNNYYVYLFWRKDKNEVFHVGKGKNNRMFEKSANRNNYFKRICNITETYSTIYKNDLFEDEAFELEKQMIKYYRELGLAYTNFHEGGRGGNVYKYDGEKRKQKMIKKCKTAALGENNPMYKTNWQKFCTDEEIKNHRDNISKSMKKRYKNPKSRKITGIKSKEVWTRPEHRKKMEITTSKTIHMYDKSNKYIMSFIKMEAAASFLNMKGHVGLRNAIKKSILFKNYYWRRENEKGVTTIEKEPIWFTK